MKIPKKISASFLAFFKKIEPDLKKVYSYNKKKHVFLDPKIINTYILLVILPSSFFS